MATVRPQDAICRIVKHGILELEKQAGRKPDYNGFLMIDGMLIVVDDIEWNLEIYNGHNGKRITSHRLEDSPNDVCLINKNEVAVSLFNGTVVILSLKSIDDVKLVKTLKTGFEYCDSLAKWNSDKLVVSGRHYGMLCWGILSIRDGRMDSTHNIFIGYRTCMAVKDNTLYISCQTLDSINNGVYAYDFSNPQTLKFLYKHQELIKPWSIMVDRDYVYVCDRNSNRIHQLTDSGQLVTIHTVSSDLDSIFYDDQHGLLYTTHGYGSNVITVYKMESLHQPEKLHQTVLNRCLPQLLTDLDVKAVMIYIQQKELFDEVTIRDINEQKITIDKTSHLIEQIKKRDQDTYVRFKEYLNLAQQADLKRMLEKVEENLAAEMKEKLRGVDASNTKMPMQAGAKKDMDEPKTKEERYFLASRMLQKETPEEIISPKPNSQIESSPVLCYVFTNNFLPSAIFHSLVAACIAHWPVAKMKIEHMEMIFSDCCVFQLDEQHKLTLHFREHVIFLRVTRMGIKDKTPFSKLCIEVREFITTNIKKIIGYPGEGLKFEYFIQCPEYNGVSVNCLIPVSILNENAEVHCEFHDHMIESYKVLDFWFKDQAKNVDGQDKDDVVTQDLINYARLCNALITVCSNALREILLTNVPMPHTDIYKAILANKAKLNKLNKDQVMLVFPDPQGLSTGKVEEFNLSLLYTIIRKVSSVPAPSNGWGNQPADNPRDTTLGANVERIRMYRNEISGHSVDGKISQQKFEDYWAKIDEVLREIEIVIGNHGYLEELEKRKNQAFTRHEAHELQKKFQEYKRNIKGNPLEAIRPVDVLLAIISDKSIETILQMITSLQESEIHDIEIRNVSTYLQHIHMESLTQSERRKEDIFKALFDSCKSDLLNTLKTGEHSDDILRSALQYILPINDPSAKAAILNVAGANLKSKLSNPDCDVWGGLDVRIDSKCRVSLVCLHRGNLNTQPDSHLGLPVLYREYDRIEREPFEASFSDEYHTLISPEDLRRANLLINKHGEELFKKHTNLVAISPSSVLSSKSRGLKIEPSIVLYCRMKGVIPIGENHFPKTLELEGIILSTDIREGLFTFVMREQAQQKPFRPIDRNNKLRMGCSIGRENSNSSGTLGPFVRLGSDVGFITCAHVIGFDKRIVLNQPVVQPADGDSDDSERACGTVLDVHFDPDKPVDAALIKVNNRDVAPTDFTWFNTEEVRNAGFDPTKPPSFLGGSVRMDTGFSDAQGKRVIKCGKKTGLTKGSLALNGIMIRIDDCRFVFPAGITWNEFSAVVMKNQYLVENNRYPFCSCGDSGAGVYLVENEQNNLSLIGILIGLLNDYTIVTPIGPVLESLQLKPEDVIADELVQKTTEIPKSSRSYCTPQ